ncbi:MAG: ABC transporter ATP-binding protein [Eubacteriales bacterium]|nr:ABC transporter ATP-binding protein [Eubacteriales bacterium]
MTTNLLEYRNVSKVFRIGGMLRGKKLLAVDDVSFAIESGRPMIMSIVGESGCGKTTLCKMLLRIHTPDKGQILVNGVDIFDRKRYTRNQFYNDIQPIFQNPFDAFSMRKRVDSYLLNTVLHCGRVHSKMDAKNIMDETLKSVGLSLKLVEGKFASQFSGGELQRVSIARALITRPKIIVADEPVAMIDASMKMNIVNLFKTLKDEYNVSFIYITHDLSTAYYVSDHICTLYRGELIEYGDSKDIMDYPAHPYTQLLMDSIPRVGDKWTQDVALPDIETKEYSLSCCKFAPRCPYATDECRASRPDMLNFGTNRKVLCRHPLSK